MEIREMKTSTLQNKVKKVNKDIDKAHINANYEKLDDLLLLKNQLEVELEVR
ncbi:hypothetical protein [Staphylococcus shinii]|uniref:hypothetical protein n=1 Tax=Staphylococcus shinii TaxID=2912228 RepID=UPI003514017F